MTSKIFSLKPAINFIRLNKKLYLFSLLVSVAGLILGIILSTTGGMEGGVYSTGQTSLYDIIVNDYSAFSLLWENLIRLILPLLIIYLLSLTKYTSFLAFIYLGYQSMLLGASIIGLVQENGVAGIINGLVVVLPINAVNFLLLVSGLVVFIKRLNLSISQRITILHSTKIMLPKLLYIFVCALFASFIYAFIYPLLLRSMVVINL